MAGVAPRIAPLPEDEIDEELRERLGGSPLLNVFRTLAVHPDLLRRWLVFGTHVVAKSTLDPRDRELAILRTGWRSDCAYEFGQHSVIGRDAGLTDEEIRRVTDEDAAGWSERQHLVLRAVDELCADATIADETWTGLTGHFDEQQLLDLVFTVGQYRLVSMALNSIGVEIDPGFPGFPEP